MNILFKIILRLSIAFYLLSLLNGFASIYFESHPNRPFTLLLLLIAVALFIIDRLTKNADLNKQKAATIFGLLFLLFFSVVVLNELWGIGYKWNGHGFTSNAELTREEDELADREELKPYLKHFDSLINQHPNSDTLHYKKACFLQNRGQYGEAIEEFKKTVAISPNDTDACFQCARCYEILKDTADAIVYYKKALTIDMSNKYVRGYIKVLIHDSIPPK